MIYWDWDKIIRLGHTYWIHIKKKRFCSVDLTLNTPYSITGARNFHTKTNLRIQVDVFTSISDETPNVRARLDMHIQTS